VGRWSKIAEKAGVGLPAGEGRTAKDAIDGLLELSRSQESQARQLACRNLCTCHVRADDDRVWTRLLELAGDPDPRVRGDVIHAITDSSPATTTRTRGFAGGSARPSPTTAGPAR
jgi:hypothetical protein